MKYLLTVLLLTSLSALANDCGLQGTIKERIEDCSREVRSKKENFALVTRVENYDGKEYTYKEIYKDKNTGALWGEKILTKVKQSEAKSQCERYVDGLNPNIKWKLPSVRQFKRADRHGLKEAMPSVRGTFWTTSLPIIGRKQGHVFSYSIGSGKLYTFGGANYSYNFTRCIGRI